jgi:hypothetical protein
LLENKELELKDILRKLESTDAREDEAAPVPLKSAREPGSGASDFFALLKGSYRDNKFAEGYRLLRSNRVLADRGAGVDAAIKSIARATPSAAAENARTGRNPAQEILSLLDLDVRYRLCCLDETDAFRILEETLTDGVHRELLDGFRRTNGGGVIGFFDWLRIRSFREAPEIVVRTGDPGDSFTRVAPDGRPVVTEYDEGVCEGVYVIADGQTYDFSVRNGDISG